MPPIRLLALLATLYVAQGLPHGFFSGALPLFLRDRQLSLQGVGLSTLLFLPWALKFTWAPLADRYGWERIGLRRSWILPAQGAMVLGMLGCGLLAWRGGGLPLLLALVLLVNLASASQDVAVDGLACEQLQPEHRGLGNSAQTAGYRLGMLVGGGLVLMVAGRWGWTAAFVALAALLAASMVVPAAMREPPPRGPRRVPESTWGAFTRLFRRPGILPALLFVLTAKIGDAMAASMHRVWIYDGGVSKEVLGFWVGTVGVVLGITGSILGGIVLWRSSRRAYLWGAGVLHVAIMGAIALAAWRHVGPSIGIGLLLAEELLGACFTVGVFTFMMDLVDPDAAASGYAVLASLEVSGKVLASSLAGFIAGPFGFGALFAFGAAISLPPLLLLCWWPPSMARRPASPSAATPAARAGQGPHATP